MKTRLLLTSLVLSIVFASLISFADARGFSPFHFRLADEIAYNDLWFYVDGSKVNFKVDKGEAATFPMIITSKHGNGTIVDFHATIGEQRGEIRFPPGVNIQLEPNQMILNGQNQTLNITVHASEKAPSSKYDISLVGMWKEEGKIPDVLGTGFSLHIGKDFGGDAIPVNFLEPPLKFAKNIEPQDISHIPCRNALLLILKHDGSPTCVREETKPRLIERGWMKTEIDVHNDDALIDAAKQLDSVQHFLSLYPNAEISINKEWYLITFTKSGFIEEDHSRYEPVRTKGLSINFDYDGQLMPHSIDCGGPISISVFGLEQLLEHLHNPDWCFPYDQSQFSSHEPEPDSEPISGSLLVEPSSELGAWLKNYWEKENENQDANELSSYVDIKPSIVIPENAVILSSKELDRTLDELRQSGLPIVMSAIDYDVGVIAIWTPDLTIGDKFKAELGDVPFVLLYEEAPARWETGDPGEQNEN